MVGKAFAGFHLVAPQKLQQRKKEAAITVETAKDFDPMFARAKFELALCLLNRICQLIPVQALPAVSTAAERS